jgi:hypothetical protein
VISTQMLLAQEEGLLTALLGDSYDDAVHERFLVALKEMMLVEEVRADVLHLPPVISHSR